MGTPYSDCAEAQGLGGHHLLQLCALGDAGQGMAVPYR